MQIPYARDRNFEEPSGDNRDSDGGPRDTWNKYTAATDWKGS